MFFFLSGCLQELLSCMLKLGSQLLLDFCTNQGCSPVFCMPESPCFETPTLVDRMVVTPSTQVARRIPSKAVVQRRARRARRTRETGGRLPREQGGSAQGRSQSTACDHHSVTSGSAIAAPTHSATYFGQTTEADYRGRTSHSAVLSIAWLHKS